MEWKAEENTKVAGTFPPMARTERKWTGYVEKDTAGQTNIYAVEVSYIFSLWHVEFEMVTNGLAMKLSILLFSWSGRPSHLISSW